MKIETHHRRVPWSWVGIMVFPWLPQYYLELCTGTPLAFTVRKFTDEPMMIALLTSIHLALNFLVGAFTSYLSDRVWTRWGRRKPFLVPAWIGLAVAMIYLPLAPNIWALAVTIIFWQFCMDFAKPYEPLYNEVIPPLQRGRASLLRNILQAVVGMVFNGLLLAQFDRQYGLKRVGQLIRLDGEMLVYWVGSACILVAAAILAFYVKETPPPGGVMRARFTLPSFFRDIFCRRKWWMLYLLYVCPTVAGGGMPSFAALFQTEQLGFTKAQIGHIGMIATLINVAIFVPLAGILADRVSRIRLFQIGLIVPVTINLLLFCYVRLVSDYSVTPGMLLAFVTLAGSGGFISFTWVVYGPLIYDYIPSNEFGTVSAGFSFTQGLISFVMLNAAGAWVRGSTALFGSHGHGRYDYASAYVFQFIGGVLALFISVYFMREVRLGRVIPYGRLELERM